MSAAGVFTRMKRFTLVEKSASEVGDETAWPMEVTRDQLAEILYRVKDAWFTSGSISTTIPDPEDPESTIPGLGMSMEGGDPPSDYISGNASDFLIRGYCWWGGEDDLNADDIPYFGSSYGPGELIPTTDSWGVDYLALFFPATYSPQGDIQRDVGGDERAIWLPERDTTPTARINADTLRTAFSQEMACWAASGGYWIGHNAPSQLRLEIYPELAWVDVNESGNPFDPSNKLYLKMRFGVFCSATADMVLLDTKPDSGFHSYVEATDLVFQLASSTCSAKIYCYSGYDVAEFSSASPFVITAKEWWPYAKPGGAVWNTTLGAKL